MPHHLRVLKQILRRHRGKATLITAIVVLAVAIKRGWANRLFVWLLGRAQAKMIQEAKIRSDQTKGQLERIKGLNDGLVEFVQKGLRDSTHTLSEFWQENYNNGMLFEALKRKEITSATKSDIWAKISHNILEKVGVLVVVKPYLDLIHYLVQVIAKRPLKEKQEYSLYSEGAPQDTLRKFGKDISRLALENWRKVKLVAAYEIADLWRWSLALTEKVTFDTLATDIRNFCDRLTQQKINFTETFPEGAVPMDPDTCASRMLIMKPGKSTWQQWFQNSSTEKTVVRQFSELLKGFRIECPSNLRNDAEDWAQLLLDVIGSDFAFRYAELARENLMQKLHNRILILFKKEFSEEQLFHPDSKMYFAKFLGSAEGLLEEEFMSPECVELDRQMLMQKLKLSFYLRKHLEKSTADHAPHPGVHEHEAGVQKGFELEEKDLALNQSFIGRVDLESPNTIYTTQLFLKELTGLEAQGAVLKDLAAQLK